MVGAVHLQKCYFNLHLAGFYSVSFCLSLASSFRYDLGTTPPPPPPQVTGEGSNTQTERIKRDRAAAPLTSIGSDCALTFKMPGVSALDLSAAVASPGGVVEDASISEMADSLHAVKFVPKELGIHTVSVRYRDVHIPGSPFQFTVGPLKVRTDGRRRVTGR